MSAKRSGPNRRKKNLAKRPLVRPVKPIAPTEPAARDEGPGLTPHASGGDNPPGLDHYLQLADTALGRKKKPDV